MKLTTRIVESFARWSGDNNPIFIDKNYAKRTFFGRPVAHGVLCAIEAMQRAPFGTSPKALDIEFRHPIFPDGALTVENDGRRCEIRGESGVVLTIRDATDAADQDSDFVDAPSARDTLEESISCARLRDSPREWGVAELAKNPTVHGRYPLRELPSEFCHGNCLSQLQLHLLGLCSYLVGMELPGKHSLATGLRIRFLQDSVDGASVVYQLSAKRFLSASRILELQLDVTDTEGLPLAVAKISAYVPFSPRNVNVDAMAAWLQERRNALKGKVAMVCGGSRGLGADLVAGLALCGCKVYVASRSESAELEELAQNLEAHETGFTSLIGDVSDPDWCREMSGRIVANHDRLTHLILNACAPPPILGAGVTTMQLHRDYVSDNLRLVETPIASFAEDVDTSGGVVVAVSSSYVHSAPRDLSHYMVLKQTVEGLVQACARQFRNTAYVIPRPPKLQTTWNDTPTGVASAIPSHCAALGIIGQLIDRPEPGEVRVLEEFPSESDVLASNRTDAKQRFCVALCGTYSVDTLVEPLRIWFDEIGYTVDVEIAGYGQTLQELVNPASVLCRNSNGANLIVLRIRDWLRERAASTDDVAESRDYLMSMVTDYSRALVTHRQHALCPTVLLLCPSGLDEPSSLDGCIAEAESALLSRTANIAGLVIVNAAGFESNYGANEVQRYDRLRDEIAHIPYTDEYLNIIGAIAIRHIYRPYLPLRKVMVVDCDNTLWQGVVGEDSWDGVAFESHHIALHQFLIDLSKRGILVCLCSKNIEADVWEVFEKRPELGLRPDHIVASAINWQPKSQNLRALASRLNLGLDSFCFLDDNPVECAEVRAGCPEVLTLEWPNDASQAEQLLAHVWEFDRTEATEEDQKRTQMYRNEYARKEVQNEALTFEEFIANLDLKIRVSEISAETLTRASQMTMRTNQFNFTTIRRSESEIEQLVNSPDYECRIAHVSDRFGDYGIVGLVILNLSSGRAVVDTFLMSCRVLGRGVEHRLALELGALANERGRDHVEFGVKTTSKNLPARQFLRSICPEERLSDFDNDLVCELNTEYLLSLEYDPAHDPLTDDRAAPEEIAASMIDGAQVREREVQIKRAAYDLSNVICAPSTKDPSSALPSSQQAASAPRPSLSEVESVVVGAFADSLRRSADEIMEVDELDQLQCDSLRVVEITVALSAVFPRLPSTLLFEHARVSAIVNAIGELYSAEANTSELAIHKASLDEHVSDLAVVGIGVRCAGADSPEALWALLKNGESAVRPVPPERDIFLGRLEDERQHWAGLLDAVDQFDGDFFGAPPREAQWLDPQLRMFMEIAWSALEDAGYTDRAINRSTGVFVGFMYDDYAVAANRLATRTGNETRSWEGFSLANRFSQFMGFSGPSLAIETACSSSATALHLARLALQQGDCDAAVVGGVNLILDPNRLVQLGRLGILSPDGECRPFGDAANGTVMGEGVGVVVVKRLRNALRDNDRIYGVIKGTGASTGAGSVGFTAPNPVAQAEATRRCLAVAGVDPRTISYVETHGTGTELGDPIEVRGLAMAYEDRRFWNSELGPRLHCMLGSIKPNIGHLEAGAGILGLIKVLLQLYHGERVPSLTSPIPNPHIDFRHGKFSVQTQLRPWSRIELATGDGGITTVPRRAGINSFGVGGSNVHIIVEEAQAEAARDEPEVERRNHLVLLSADRAAALAPQARALRDYLQSNPALELGDVAHSLAIAKSHLEHRVALVVESRERLLEALEALEQGELQGARRGRARQRDMRGQVVFLFTGQGSQYAGMGRDLYDTEPVFRNAVDRCAALFDATLESPLLDVLFAELDSEYGKLINQTEYTQPALFTLQYALARLWNSWGVHPDLVIGHSIGEFAAMCIAGGLSLNDAARLVAERGRLMQTLPEGGAMLAVSADEPAVQEVIEPFWAEVSVAAVNAPGEVVISGAGDAIAEIAQYLQKQEITATPLIVSHAFHSSKMEPMLEEFGAVARSVTHGTPEIAFLSSVDGRIRESTDAGYWVNNIRKPVRFMAAMKTIADQDVSTFIEIGPHPVLIGMGKRSIPQSRATWLPSLQRGKDASHTLLSSLGEHVVNGGHVNWRAYNAPFARRRTALPAYAFTRKSHWLQASAASAASAAGETDLGFHINALQRPPAQSAYQIEWREAPITAYRTCDNERWIVLGEAELAAVLAERLVGEGCDCTSIGLSNVNKAMRALRNVLRDGSDINVVLLSPRRDDMEVHAGKTLSLLSTISKAVISAPSSTKLWVITHDGVATGREAADTRYALGHGAIWGFGRVFALEEPSCWGGLIDVPGRTPKNEATESLVDQLLGKTDEDQVAYRGGRRLVPRLVPRSVPIDSIRLSSEASYLVAGGTGALGKRCARWLALRGAKNLVLCSRSGVDAEGVHELLGELSQMGVNTDVIAADMTLSADVDRAIDTATQGGRPLRGVVHAVGLDELTPISETTPASIKRVYDPKVLSAHWLHDRTRSLNLDFFVLFSSMSAVLGSVKRAPYAAANATLDLLAHERRRLGLPALAVDWGPWAGGGMASKEELETYRRAGNRGLEPDAALVQLGALLQDGMSQAVIVDIDWAQFAPIYEAKRPRKLIAECASASLSPKERVETSEDIVSDLDDLSAEERRQRIRANLKRNIRRTLELDSADDVDDEAEFFEMGMDSLMTVEFGTQIQAEFQIQDPTLIVTHPTISTLTEKLVAHLEDLHPAARTSTASVATERPADRDGEVKQQAGKPLPTDGFVDYRPELDGAIDAFQLEAWPKRGSHAAAQWRWMFLQSAARLDAEPRMWLYQDYGKVVGETGAIPFDLQVCGTRHRAAWLVDSMALEAYRAKAVGTRLMLRAVKDTPIALSLGQDEYMRRILLQSGWKHVSVVDHLVYPLRSWAVLRSKVGEPMAWLGGRGLDISMRMKQRFARPDHMWQASLVMVDRFGARHDRLWERISENMQCAGVRDSSFLNWKFIDRPHGNFAAFDVLKEDELVAIVVLAFLNPDDAYQYRRAVLVDVITSALDRASVWSVLDAVASECIENDADAIHTKVGSRELVRELLSFGYVRRQASRHLLAFLGADIDPPTADAILTSDNWWMTMADSDMDGGIAPRAYSSRDIRRASTLG